MLRRAHVCIPRVFEQDVSSGTEVGLGLQTPSGSETSSKMMHIQRVSSRIDAT